MAYAALPSTLVLENTNEVAFGISAEAFTAGYVVRKDADGTFYIADAGQADEDEVTGVALNTTLAAGQNFAYAPIGSIVTVSGLTAGQTYYLGGDADEGEVGLFSDASAGSHFATVVGIALSATRLLIIGRNTNVQL